MTIRVRFPNSGNAIDRRLARLRNVLEAAQETRYYRCMLSAAGFGTPASLDRLWSVEDVLDRLPVVPYRHVEQQPQHFRNPSPQNRWLNRLRHPSGTSPRTALFQDGFEESSTVKLFRPSEIAKLEAWGAESLAGPLHLLMFLAHMADSGYLRVPISHSVVAFTGFANGAEELLDDAARDFLWRVFQVPLFEQYLGSDGRVAAWECEAREGLHVMEENAVFSRTRNGQFAFTSLTNIQTPQLQWESRLEASFVSGECRCGRSNQPRLVELRRATSLDREPAAIMKRAAGA